jgi:tetratricopeptide (TPR) repeat protein
MPVDLMQKRRRGMVHLLRGLFEARAGRIDAARDAHRALAAVPDEGDDVLRAWRQSVSGEIALATGGLAAADAAFRAGQYQVVPSFSIVPIVVALNNNVPFRDGPARVAAARGDFAAAAALYRRLVEPDIASPWTDVAEPRFVLAAARLAARAGNRPTAINEYSRYLDLWKDADSGLPELAEARLFLARR